MESVGATASPSFSWRYGDMDHGNLLGTAKSLDGITGSINLNCSDGGSATPIYCALGPLSRNGWAVIDDTDTRRIDPSTEWIAPPAPQGAVCASIILFELCSSRTRLSHAKL